MVILFKFWSSVLQDKESKIQEAENLMQNKEAQFLEQIEQEKASTLALLQVERQMWEAERNKELGVKVQETEWVIFKFVVSWMNSVIIM